jgi:two-component system, NarL family, nitrate/nitrite response regulator NarL
MGSLVLGGDHLVFLDALSTVLDQHGHEVSAVVSSSASLTESVGRQPDACVISLDATGRECADLVQCLHVASPRTAILLVSAYADQRAVLQALEAGAAGYLHKSRRLLALVAGIERGSNGETIVDIPRELSVRSSVRVDGKLWLAARLTARERECRAMLVEGLDTAAMVTRLGVSRTTVRTHIQAVLTKLGAHSRLEAASVAVWLSGQVARRRPDAVSARPGDASPLPSPRSQPNDPALTTSGFPPASALANARRGVGPAQPVGVGAFTPLTENRANTGRHNRYVSTLEARND